MRIKAFVLVAAALALLVPTGLAALDTSKRVEIQFYMLGDPPKDLPVIQAEVNKLALAELNCTVKFNYIPWAGWDQKYNLILSSGQAVDLIFTADWTDYNKYARQGAFMDIGSIVRTAAPDLYKFVPAEYWEAVKVGGKVYTVPATWKEYVNNGITYREDLRRKYNLPKPDSIANAEAYMEGIKKNLPEMQPLNQLKGFPFLNQIVSGFKYPYIEAPISSDVAYGLRYDYRKPQELFSYYDSPDFVEDAKLLKRWADKGFWSKSALSADSPGEALVNGAIAMQADGQNPVKYATAISKIANSHPDWEFGYIPFCYTDKLVHPVHPTHNGFAVPRSAKNPDRALAFYAKLVLDKRYNWLTEYGIQGKNFEITADGHYKIIGDSNSNGFGREAMNGWAWRNPNFQLFGESMDLVLKLFKEFDGIQTPNIRDGFAVDRTSFQAEEAAFNQVFTQYGLPIYYGLAGDPVAAVKTFREKAKAAGLGKIQAEVTRQWVAYCKEHDYK